MTPFVLFDLDNTLFDRQAAFRDWATSFAETRGLGRPGVEVLCEADEDGFASRDDVFNAVRARFGLADSTEDLVAEYRHDYLTFVRPDPAIQGDLKRLHARGFRLGIITNGPSTQHDKVVRLGLAPLVDGVCVSHDFGAEKPDSRIFQEAIRLCCGRFVPADAGWMVGDSGPHDIAGALAVGIPSIWLSRGRRWTEAAFEPDFIATNTAEAIVHIIQVSADQG